MCAAAEPLCTPGAAVCTSVAASPPRPPAAGSALFAAAARMDENVPVPSMTREARKRRCCTDWSTTQSMAALDEDTSSFERRATTTSGDDADGLSFGTTSSSSEHSDADTEADVEPEAGIKSARLFCGGASGAVAHPGAPFEDWKAAAAATAAGAVAALDESVNARLGQFSEQQKPQQTCGVCDDTAAGVPTAPLLYSIYCTRVCSRINRFTRVDFSDN